MKLDDLVLKLVEFDTQNGDEDSGHKGETVPLLNFCKDELSEINNAVVELTPYRIPFNPPKMNDGGEEIFYRENRANLVAQLNNPNTSKPTVLLQGHVDTVPIGETKEWQYNPFGERRGDLIYGRGTSDMKGSIAAMMITFEELAQKDLRYNPVLLFTSDEEANTFTGIKEFLKNQKINPNYAICCDGDSLVIKNRFKGALHQSITFNGKSAHGSKPWIGKNAILSAIPTINNVRNLISEIEKIENPDFESADPHSRHATMNFGRINGGTKVNMVPEKCVVEFEMRLVSKAQTYIDLIQERILSKISPDDKYDPKLHFAKEPFILPDNEFTFALERNIKKYKSPERGVMFGFSEATPLNEAGIPTVVFGGGLLDQDHSTDEHVSLRDLEMLKAILVDFFKE